MVDRIQHSRIHVKEARRLSGQMRIASGLVTGDRAFTSVKGFLDKWEIVRDKLRFVVAAVNTISEVCLLSLIVSPIFTCFSRFIRTLNLPGV